MTFTLISEDRYEGKPPSISIHSSNKDAINMAGILDLDLNAVTDPNEPAPESKYRVVITKAEIKNSDTGSVGVVIGRKILTPGEHQGKTFQNYVNLQTKDGSENKFGTWEVKTLLALKKVKKGTLKENIPQLVGLEHDAIVGVEIPKPDSDQEQYGPKNYVKKVLV